MAPNRLKITVITTRPNKTNVTTSNAKGCPQVNLESWSTNTSRITVAIIVIAQYTVHCTHMNSNEVERSGSFRVTLVPQVWVFSPDEDVLPNNLL